MYSAHFKELLRLKLFENELPSNIDYLWLNNGCALLSFCAHCVVHVVLTLAIIKVIYFELAVRVSLIEFPKYIFFGEIIKSCMLWVELLLLCGKIEGS